jgi:hypothetical protein
MMPPTSRTGFRSTTSGSDRRAAAWRICRVLLVGAGLAVIGLWLSSLIGAPSPTEPLVGSLAREGFAPGFGVASAAILVLVWSASPRQVTDVRALDSATVITDGASTSRASTARRADASLTAVARGQSSISSIRDVRQAHTPRPERRSETGSRHVEWASARSTTGLRYSGVATSELRRPMSTTLR